MVGVSIHDLANEAADQARRIKEMAAADSHSADDRPELRPSIQGWRGLAPVVLMIPSQVDRDEGLKAAWIAATGFGCDSIAFTVDTWSARTRTNPVTGKPWGPREMQDVVHNHDGMAKGWITEGLSTFVVNRAGDLASVMQQYRLDGHTNALGIHRWSIEWGERYSNAERGGPDKVEGVVPEALLRYMNEPTMMQSIGRAGILARDFGLDDVEAQAHADCAVIKSLPMTGVWEGAAMLMSDDPRRAAIIDESLGHMRLDLP